MPPSVSGPYWGRSAPLQVIEIELRGVGEEILVACGIDDEFRHHQTIAIRIGIFDTEQRLELRSAGPSHNAGPLEFGNCRSPETVGAVVVLERTGRPPARCGVLSCRSSSGPMKATPISSPANWASTRSRSLP